MRPPLPSPAGDHAGARECQLSDLTRVLSAAEAGVRSQLVQGGQAIAGHVVENSCGFVRFPDAQLPFRDRPGMASILPSAGLPCCRPAVCLSLSQARALLDVASSEVAKEHVVQLRLPKVEDVRPVDRQCLGRPVPLVDASSETLESLVQPLAKTDALAACPRAVPQRSSLAANRLLCLVTRAEARSCDLDALSLGVVAAVNGEGPRAAASGLVGPSVVADWMEVGRLLPSDEHI